MQFLAKVSEMDSLTTRNSPSFSLQKGELLTMELYSPPLDGLSQVDFEIAMNINRMNFSEYLLIPVNSPEKY